MVQHAVQRLFAQAGFTRKFLEGDSGVNQIAQAGKRLRRLARQQQWKRQQSLIRTLENRPDLLREAPLTDEDHEFIAQYINQRLEESQFKEE